MFLSKKLEFGISLFFGGILMIIFPDFHNEGTKVNFGNPGTLYAGIFFLFIGGIILLVEIKNWYKKREDKKDEKHNNNSSS